MRHTLGIALVLTCLATSRSAAQTVAGVVRDALAGSPVHGGFVVLLDEGTGLEVVRTLGDREGRFSLTAPRPGSYRLRSVRIGYRSYTSDAFTLAEGERIEHDLSVPAVVLRLTDLNVEAERTCRTRPERGEATAAVWEEAKKALEAVTWTEDRELYTFETETYERDLDRRLRVRSEERQPKMIRSARVFVTAVRPEVLAERGYVMDDGGERVYHAPDAQVLFSNSFVEQHCFRLADREDGSGLVGLEFEPVSDTRFADVSGVLWLDAETAELRHLDFSYENVRLGVQAPEVGGRIEFMRLQDGSWVVSRWWIRTPRLQDARGERRLEGYLETGGVVRSARSRFQTRSFDLGSVTVEGVVWDSAAGGPLEWATVQLVGTQHTTQTNPNGWFRLAGIPEGAYRLEVSHDRLEMLRVQLGTDLPDARSGTIRSIELAVPPVTGVALNVCPNSRWPDDAVVVGRVRRRGSVVPVPGAMVEVSWSGLVDHAVRRHWVRVPTEGDGTFVACGLPREKGLTVVVRGDAGVTSRELTPTVSSFWVVRLEIDVAGA